MRKSVSIVICAGALLIAATATAAASGPQVAITGGVDAVAPPLALPVSQGQDGLSKPAQVYIDDVALQTNPAPFFKDGQVWVPVREVWELLGATVTYDGTTGTVRAVRGDGRAGMTLDSTHAMVDTTAVELPAPPVVLAGRTFAPLSFVAASLNAKMIWDGQAARVDSGLPPGTVSRNQRLPELLQRVVDLARSLEGVPYRWGATSPKTGFDCSGFILYVARAGGADLPRTTFEMYRVGKPVPRNQLRPGDLVFFTTYTAGASHAGIYLGNGQFIHANSTGGQVRITDLDSDYYARRYLGARRIFDVPDLP